MATNRPAPHSHAMADLSHPSPQLTRRHAVVLRLEAAATFFVALVVFGAVGGEWSYFLATFLIPDLSMLAYLHSPTVGSRVYNLAHTHVSAFVLLGFAWIVGALPTFTGQSATIEAPGSALLLQFALVWFAHVAFDRMLGYGLKHPTGFRDTHLGTLAGLRHATQPTPAVARSAEPPTRARRASGREA